MNIFLIPLEPLVERYTASWYSNIPEAFRSHFKTGNVVVVDGAPLNSFVDVGTFLDLNSSSHYKSEQLKKVSQLFYDKKVNDGDIFFVFDIQFPGIECIRLLSDLQGIKVGLFGFCHASSYTFEDFMAPAAPYLKYFELGWLTVFDKVFVGTHYHKNAIVERRINPFVRSNVERAKLETKICVSGNPIFMDDYSAVLCKKLPKKKQLIISNRFDWEKRPNLSLDFCYILKRKIPDLKIVVTTSRPQFKSNKKWLVDLARCMEKDGILEIEEGLSKDEYHTILAESKVFLTNTAEENFGYCLVEAIIFNTYPVAEKAFSHPEILKWDSRFLFSDTDEVVDKITNLLDLNEDISYLGNRFTRSLDNMLGAML